MLWQTRCAAGSITGMPSTVQPRSAHTGLAIGIALGAGFGLLLGLLMFGSPALGIGIGMALGVALGAAFDGRKQRSDDAKPTP